MWGRKKKVGIALSGGAARGLALKIGKFFNKSVEEIFYLEEDQVKE